MAKKQFKAESKRLLDLMINSIYTHKEIFLRELISNASDAIDRLYFRSLTDTSVSKTRDDFFIRITADETARTLSISDNGIGMDKQGLEEHLGVIAESGTLAFRKEHEGEAQQDTDVIGQFGVGFYSAFMVASHIEVVSRAFGSEEAWKWVSDGADGYTVVPGERAEVGTTVTLTIREDTDDEKYGRFLSQYTIQSLVKKYSDYIRYPIRMVLNKSRLKEGSESEYESYTEDAVLNSMTPLWKRPKAEITPEEYSAFYQSKFHDQGDPLLTIHTSAEGTVSYNALMFVPAEPPFDFYSKDFQRGLQLYASGVMIMEKCEDLLPDFFGFVTGLVDSPDLSLNISREMLQHDRQLRVIAQNLKKKIHAELTALMQNDREKYERFYVAYGRMLKYGTFSGYGMNGDLLNGLLLFHSAREHKLVSLAEYVGAMAEGQKFIYYACADSASRAEKLPQAELARSKGYDVLCMTDDMDEFVVNALGTFMEKPFKSVSGQDTGLADDAEKKEAEEKAKDSRSLLDAMKQALDGLVKDVRLSDRLVSSPVCLTADGALSIEMEKVFAAMPSTPGQGEGMKAERVLEINPTHPVFAALTALPENDPKIASYARLLYDQALLIEGLPIDDPVEFSNHICELMV